MGGGERGRRQGRHGRAGRLPSALGPGFADRGSCKQPLWCLIQCLHFRSLGCFPAGDYKQHNHTQHDFHQNVAEVWAVGRQQSQHGIWLGVFVGAAADKGNGGPPQSGTCRVGGHCHQQSLAGEWNGVLGEQSSSLPSLSPFLLGCQPGRAFRNTRFLENGDVVGGRKTSDKCCFGA